jgi:hypothetical protein
MKALSILSLSGLAVSAVCVSSATAMPLAQRGLASPDLAQDVRMVCNQFGRCFQTGPRYGMVRRHYIAPAYSYSRSYYAEPSYSYSRSYYAEPSYGYVPSYGHHYWGGGPSVGFSVGPRW